MSYITAQRDDFDCACTDPSCGCGDSEQNTYTDGLLRYLADQAALALVFLPDGRIWSGEEAGLFELGNQLTKEREAEDKSLLAEHELWMKAEAERTKEAVIEQFTLPELEYAIAKLKAKGDQPRKHLHFIDEDEDVLKKPN